MHHVALLNRPFLAAGPDTAAAGLNIPALLDLLVDIVAGFRIAAVDLRDAERGVFELEMILVEPRRTDVLRDDGLGFIDNILITYCMFFTVTARTALHKRKNTGRIVANMCELLI